MNKRPLTLPKNITAWDRFWHHVVFFLGVMQQVIFKYCIKEPVWRSQDGRVRRLRDLDTSHLLNIEGVLMREGRSNTAIYDYINAELFGRGLTFNKNRRNKKHHKDDEIPF